MNEYQLYITKLRLNPPFIISVRSEGEIRILKGIMKMLFCGWHGI